MAEPVVCPTCGKSETNLRIADLPENGPVRIKAPHAPTIKRSAFGCMPLTLITLGSILAAVVIGGIAQINAVSTTNDLRPGDTAVFTGILVLMIVFVGLFSVLTWRQVRADTTLRLQLGEWRTAVDRHEQLHYCTTCQTVSLPNSPRTVPVDQAELLLYG